MGLRLSWAVAWVWAQAGVWEAWAEPRLGPELGPELELKLWSAGVWAGAQARAWAGARVGVSAGPRLGLGCVLGWGPD